MTPKPDQTSPDGLTGAETQKRLTQYGPNEIAEKKTNSLLKFLTYSWGPIPWMEKAETIVSETSSCVYRATVPTTRPATDYTARVIPRRSGVAIPWNPLASSGSDDGDARTRVARLHCRDRRPR